jgi:Uma2 family endonuclease
MMVAPSRLKSAPFAAGDRMTRAEFHRLYEAAPHIKKAELIEGVVYMPSPVRFDTHGQPQSLVVRWLGAYCDHNTGIEIGIDSTVELDNDNEPQPDVQLRRIEGGSSRVSSQGYVQGPPELVVEVAASSQAYDMHAKLNAYRRNGVQEYIVWQMKERRITWFALQDGQYVALEPDARGIIHSRVFPGLRLKVEAMLNGDIKGVLAEQRRAARVRPKA